MREQFPGYCKPTKNELDSSWTTSTIAFDANALLNLYRYSKPTRLEFLRVLKAIHGRLWLPYQAALEFHRNRYGVIETQAKSYDSVYREAEKTINDLKSRLGGFSRHPFIDTELLDAHFRAALVNVRSDLDKLKKVHDEEADFEKLHESIDALFTGRLGVQFSGEELKGIYKDGEQRYVHRIPPGWADADKKKGDEARLYGDLVIWKELLKKGKEERQPIIFVTDDRKADWWESVTPTQKVPCPELVKEFLEYSGCRILIYQADEFLERAKKRLVSDLQPKSIEEAKELRKKDEGADVYKGGLSSSMASYFQRPGLFTLGSRLGYLPWSTEPIYLSPQALQDMNQFQWITDMQNSLNSIRGIPMMNFEPPPAELNEGQHIGHEPGPLSNIPDGEN